MEYNAEKIETHFRRRSPGGEAKCSGKYSKMQRNRKQRQRLKNTENEPEYGKYSGWEF